MAMLNNQMVSWASLWVSVFSVRFRSFGATACIASCGSTHLSQLLGFTTFLDAPVLRGTTVQRYMTTVFFIDHSLYKSKFKTQGGPTISGCFFDWPFLFLGDTPSLALAQGDFWWFLPSEGMTCPMFKHGRLESTSMSLPSSLRSHGAMLGGSWWSFP